MRKPFETVHVSFSLRFQEIFQNTWWLLLERAVVKTEEVIRNVGITGSVLRVTPSKCILWTQDVNWTYIKHSEDVLDFFWTSCIHWVCILYLGERNYLQNPQGSDYGPANFMKHGFELEMHVVNLSQFV